MPILTKNSGMQRRIFIITTLFLILMGFANAQQPEPCVNPVMTPLCSQACVICDIDGFSGINNSQTTGVAPNDFCTTQEHNVTWIAFIAGSTDLTLQVAVTNCQIDWGLEIGIYESLDCENFSQVTFCNTDVQENTVATFSNTAPLTVGQYYYFVMDGSNGDVCNYEVSVTLGTTEVGALAPIAGLSGPDTGCPNTTQTFEAPQLIGANFTEWYINGDLIYNGSEIFEHTWGDQEGIFEICYRAYNVCDTIPAVCKNVTIASLPGIDYIEEICTDDCFYIPEIDTCVGEAGFHSFIQTLDNNCQRDVTLDLSISPPIYTQLELEFCFGDSVIIGDEAFTQTGNYEISLEGILYCDSIIQLDLTTFLCDIEGGFADDNLSCNGASDGTLEFNLVDGNFPYTYSWEEETGTGLNGTGMSNSTNGQIVINNLPHGIYSITVTDASGSMGIFLGQVFEPTPLLADFSFSDYNGYGVSCPDDNDGSITVSASGGTPGYDYLWFNNETGPMIDSLEGGNYTITITDTNGCTAVFNPLLVAPSGITTNVIITEPGCNPDDSGIITLDNTRGGAEPFAYSLDQGAFVPDSVFANLFPGAYNVDILDANGCQVSYNGIELMNPNILILDLGPDQTITLGYNTTINPFTNLFSLDFDWRNDAGLSCLDCRNPEIMPTETTTYLATATMSNGCLQTDSVTIFVEKRRNFFIPNVFTPNDDGVNDFLQIFGGPEVEQVIDFQIYSRWGALVYQDDSFPVNSLDYGWDGTFKGKNASQDTYIWSAEVLFIDGHKERFNGDITLVR